MPRMTKLDRSIAGRIALVTGAASGMGRATAMLLADEGARVAIADRNESGLMETEKIMKAGGADVRAWPLDLTDGAAIKTVIAEIVAHFGGLNILINNAGIALHSPIDADDYEENWTQTIAINLTAHAHTIRAALPHLQADGAGRIVNIASTEGLGATRFNSPYAASKHGVIGLTRGLAVELGSAGVTVNCICPGPIHTGMTAAIAEPDKIKFARRRVPLRRYGDPEEVAQITLSLVLPAASYLNGAIIPVDGGLVVQNT